MKRINKLHFFIFFNLLLVFSQTQIPNINILPLEKRDFIIPKILNSNEYFLNQNTNQRKSDSVFNKTRLFKNQILINPPKIKEIDKENIGIDKSFFAAPFAYQGFLNHHTEQNNNSLEEEICKTKKEIKKKLKILRKRKEKSLKKANPNLSVSMPPLQSIEEEDTFHHSIDEIEKKCPCKCEDDTKNHLEKLTKNKTLNKSTSKIKCLKPKNTCMCLCSELQKFIVDKNQIKGIKNKKSLFNPYRQIDIYKTSRNTKINILSVKNEKHIVPIENVPLINVQTQLMGKDDIINCASGIKKGNITTKIQGDVMDNLQKNFNSNKIKSKLKLELSNSLNAGEIINSSLDYLKFNKIKDSKKVY